MLTQEKAMWVGSPCQGRMSATSKLASSNPYLNIGCLCVSMKSRLYVWPCHLAGPVDANLREQLTWEHTLKQVLLLTTLHHLENFRKSRCLVQESKVRKTWELKVKERLASNPELKQEVFSKNQSTPCRTMEELEEWRNVQKDNELCNCKEEKAKTASWDQIPADQTVRKQKQMATLLWNQLPGKRRVLKRWHGKDCGSKVCPC